jgi:hypothetical protein
LARIPKRQPGYPLVFSVLKKTFSRAGMTTTVKVVVGKDLSGVYLEV